MSVTHKNSIGKIVSYFAAITKVPFTVDDTTFSPRPLELSDSLAKAFTCPPSCGACCQKFSLEYIDGENMPGGARERVIDFDRRRIRVWSDLQSSNRSDRCKYLSPVNGRCDIYGQHPFTCEFELVRVYSGSIRNYNSIGVGQFGRSWQLTSTTLLVIASAGL